MEHAIPLPVTTSGVEGVHIRVMEYAPDRRQPPHDHPFSSLTLIFMGSIDEWVGHHHQRGGPVSVVVKPAGVLHANQIGPAGARTLQLSFLPALLESSGIEPHAWAWSHGGVATRRMYGLLRELAEQPGDAEAVGGTVLDILAGVLFERRPSATEPPTWLLRIACVIDESFRQPPRVGALAAEAGVHPVVLARYFRRHFGSSITERVRRRRVEEAVRLIGRKAPLSAIAAECGFSDQAHFTRVFSGTTGLTPGRFRQTASSF